MPVVISRFFFFADFRRHAVAAMPPHAAATILLIRHAADYAPLPRRRCRRHFDCHCHAALPDAFLSCREVAAAIAASRQLAFRCRRRHKIYAMMPPLPLPMLPR